MNPLVTKIALVSGGVVLGAGATYLVMRRRTRILEKSLETALEIEVEVVDAKEDPAHSDGGVAFDISDLSLIHI